MKMWITGYIGSGKSTISQKIKEIFEFDNIEMLLKAKGYKLKDLSDKEFKRLVVKELDNIDDVVIEGIQCCDYYKKGDKVYFVKTNFLESLKRAYKRDGFRKIFQHFFDNFILMFRLKKLYKKVKLNNDLIDDIKKLQVKE